MSFPASNRLLWIVCAVFLDGLAAVFGAALREDIILRWKEHFMSAAAGVMLGVAFMEVFPEALDKGLAPEHAGGAFLVGFFAFYAFEQFFSHHTAEHAVNTQREGHHENHSTIGPSLLFGDALHNITDGVAVATAFLSSVNVGISLALAVFFHELPHETGDYAVLVAHGYSRKRALLWMFAIQMSALIGAVGVYLMASFIMGVVPWLLALSAGGFVYIAAAKLLPSVIAAPASDSGRWGKAMIFLAGLILAGVLRWAFGA